MNIVLKDSQTGVRQSFCCTYATQTGGIQRRPLVACDAMGGWGVFTRLSVTRCHGNGRKLLLAPKRNAVGESKGRTVLHAEKILSSFSLLDTVCLLNMSVLRPPPGGLETCSNAGPSRRSFPLSSRTDSQCIQYIKLYICATSRCTKAGVGLQQHKISKNGKVVNPTSRHVAM